MERREIKIIKLFQSSVAVLGYLLFISGCASSSVVSNSTKYKSNNKIESLVILPMTVNEPTNSMYFAEQKLGWSIEKSAKRQKIPTKAAAVENTRTELEVRKVLARDRSSHVMTIEILQGTILTKKDPKYKGDSFMSEYEASIVLIELSSWREVWRSTIRVKLGLGGGEETIGDKIIDKMRENGLLAEGL